MSRPISHRSHYVHHRSFTFARNTRTRTSRNARSPVPLDFASIFSPPPPSLLLLAPFSVHSFLDLSHLVFSLISPSFTFSSPPLRSSSSPICISTSLLSPESHASSSPRYIIIADRSHDHCRGHQRSTRQQQLPRVLVACSDWTRRGVRSRNREILAGTAVRN